MLGLVHRAVLVRAVLVLDPEQVAHLFHLGVFLVDRGEVLRPEGCGLHRGDIAFEFRQRCGGRHGFAEGDRVALGIQAVHAEHADDEGHLGRLEVLAHVADEIGQPLAVFRVIPGLAIRAVGIGAAVHEVIEALEPDEAGDFITLGGNAGRADALGIGQHAFHVVDHITIEAAAFLCLLGFLHLDVLALLFHLFDLCLAEHIGPGTGRAEFGVEAPAAPRGLDEEHRLLERGIHGQAERELGADLAAGLGGIGASGAESRGELAGALAIGVALVVAGQIGDPHVVGDCRLSIRAAHHLEQRRGGGVVTDVVEGLDARVALHVRLAGEDEDLEGLRFHADGGEQHGCEEGGGGFHGGG